MLSSSPSAVLAAVLYRRNERGSVRHVQVNTDQNAFFATVLFQRKLLGCAIPAQVAFVRNDLSTAEHSPKKLPVSAGVA